MANDVDTLSIAEEVSRLPAEAKLIAARHCQLTGRPLGISGEVAEHDAARLLGIEFARVRELAFDAFQHLDGRTYRLQIKGRAVDPAHRYIGRVPKIKLEPEFDAVLLVLHDKHTFNTLEIWRAEYGDIRTRLSKPGSKSRNERGSMGISQFKSIAKKIWPLSKTLA